MAVKGQQLYEGKAKKVYATDSPDYYIVEYKDDATAFNGEKRGTIAGKGVINNQMSNRLFALLKDHGVENHFVEQLSERETLVRAVRIVPVEVVVRNLTAGSMAKRLGLEEGLELSRPIVEFYYKQDDLGDPLVTPDHVEVLGWATAAEIAQMQSMALCVNEVLGAYLRARGVLLVDFKLEFGRLKDGTLILADEISPDTCRFWDATTREKLDKDRFRRDLGGVEDAYQEMMRRVSEEES
ncbi:phosphoribosylaminoimidazolesuccinocarboxamide synthase [Alicyclobacillus cycloheptanicus]|uniref:Phosphoribosylaminoimidazole-succinocarboxamide synthase n=1 Tax=Alicyclobacillus cycloheptanicus TaxID=1457 RepID=A0ABT9XLR1_9BACL|nr:phosphoribosylaminoimidazolesuccinocarboxamide synthase [Alicyclobacillus cycloheptanicus]MDQ0191162.1 phosphoribosylaminoimidazole-succinocarboxamide synthase [Alicyclobacillus cycloheptanicus]WDM02010.1 phosphoribosylaminoimidazolesuccinocarboxamide synthase [Alicyclobacillus cycloheptanicus]